MTELPKGWAEISLEELSGPTAPIIYGILQPGPDTAGGVPYVRPTEIKNDKINLDSLRRTTPEIAEKYRRSTLAEGDILLSIVGTIGKVATVPDKLDGANITQSSCRIRVDQGVAINDFAASFLRSPQARDQYDNKRLGSAVPRLNLADVRRISIPIAPINEQRRIVAKLASLRARSERAHHELDLIPNLIEHYKQAILAKAFSGELTKDWREKHPESGDAQTVLNQIVQTRQSLIDGGCPKRRGPISNVEGGRVPVELGELPACWQTSSLDQITNPSRLIQYGILKPGDDVPDGVPYVKVMNIQAGYVQLGKIRRTTPEIHHQYRRSTIQAGDIVLSIRGTVGRLAFVPDELDGGNITQDSVRIDVLPPVNSKYVYWYLHSPFAQQYFARNQKGVAVRGINVGDVRPMEIPIASKAEQDHIVSLVEKAIAWLEKIVTEHARAEHLLPKLDRAILAKAFRGELVPQDPSDEPASVLLERIKAEQASAEKPKRGRRAKERA